MQHESLDFFATKMLGENSKCKQGTAFPIPKDAKKDDLSDILSARVFQSL
jgi:hypothetical protein